MRHLQSLLIKPVGSFCNIHCDYCFYLEKHALYPGPVSRHRMSDEVLEGLIRQMFACSNAPTFTWHGGEPTIMGLAFFERAVALQRRYCRPGQRYFNALQTHGLLLDEAWADFLRRENFLVGVSLDGPQAVHDRYRKDARGQGTFERAFANARLLLDRGVEVNVLATVNDHSVQHAEAIYRFFTAHGFSFMQFSPVVESDPNDPTRAAPFSVDAQAYGRFLTRLFELWLEDFDWAHLRQGSSIRFFDALVKRYVGMVPDHCAMLQDCAVYLVAEHTGDLYSCDFLVDAQSRVGHLFEEGLQGAFDSAAHRAFGQRKADYGETCARCRWLKLCYGGCIKDRLRDPRDQGHNRFCAAYLDFFKRAHPELERLAALYRTHYSQ